MCLHTLFFAVCACTFFSFALWFTSVSQYSVVARTLCSTVAHNELKQQGYEQCRDAHHSRGTARQHRSRRSLTLAQSLRHVAAAALLCGYCRLLCGLIDMGAWALLSLPRLGRFFLDSQFVGLRARRDDTRWQHGRGTRAAIVTQHPHIRALSPRARRR